LKTLTIIPEDNMVVVDGEGLVIDVAVDADIHAIQWDYEIQEGTIEYKSDKDTIVIGTDEIAPYLSLATSHTNEKTRIVDAVKAEELFRLEHEGLYSTKRANAFDSELSIGDQLDEILRFMDIQPDKTPAMQSIIDKSKDIKNRFPKS
jgi:hypothetical protein